MTRAYVLTVEPKTKYLHITVRGKNTPENVLICLSEVREKCLQHECPNVLIEEHLNGPSLHTFTMFDNITEASKRVHPVISHIAYVDVNPEHDWNQLKFAENVAVNRAVNVKLFPSVTEAEKWLSNMP
jgi:hypothetical protein